MGSVRTPLANQTTARKPRTSKNREDVINVESFTMGFVASTT
jgi:hypothetical protein